ncbi:MAG: S8 family serine peptidase [Nitrosomonadales bacterium]|nr:S8 family serine peptidase [Nitrosomonadales bacterium]
MSRQVYAMGAIQQFRYLILGLVLFSFPWLQAYGAGEKGTTGGARLSQVRHFTPDAKGGLQGLIAEPYALKVGGGKTSVRFTVRLPGAVDTAAKVYLHRTSDRKPYVMNDEGRDGDPAAKDGVYGKSIVVDVSGLKPDACLLFEAYAQSKKGKKLSSTFKLCASAFPMQIAASDATRQVKFSDGSRAISDEILFTAAPNANSDTIRRVAKAINASIVGSIPALRLYQLKLGSQVSGSQFPELVRRLQSSPGVQAVSLNHIGTFASNDTHFPSQHGLQLMRAPDVWGSGATGSGVTVVVLDSGLDLTHADLVPSWTCQLPGNPALVPCTDTVGHGTMVAGVVAAVTGNSAGVAGVAYGSNIHSIKVNSTPNPNDPTHPFVLLADMQAAFNEAATYVGSHGAASVINASFSVQVSTFTNVTSLCQSINNAVVSGAVVANAAGNDNSNQYFYPGRCNINEPAGQPHAGQNEALVTKGRFISVANSVSQQNSDCMVNGLVGGTQDAIDSRCEGYNNASSIRIFGSNYGSWVDLIAPGARIYTTSLGGGYVEPTGTSFSSPLVAGAAAILKSCGVSLDQIEPTLKASGFPSVSFPDGTSAPRLDIYRALHRSAPTASNMSAAETFTEDTPLNLVDIVVTDANGCATVTATLTLSNLAAGTLSTATFGSVTSTFVGGVWTASGPLADVNALLAGVTFNPASHFNGSFNIATSVSDGYSPAIAGTKVVNGIAVNDVPGFVKGADQTVLEDAGPQSVSGWATAISAGPADEAGQTLTFNITGNTNPSLFSTAPAVSSAGALSYTPTGNANGTATITLRLQDGGGIANGGVDTSPPQSFVINVMAVNDVPSFVKGADQTVLENSGPQMVAGWATAISAGPADEAGQALNFNITGNTNPGLFSAGPAISSTGDLSYTPAANTSGSATITIQLHDTGGVANGGVDTSASQSFTINVTHVPVPPSGSVGIDGVRQVSAPQPSLHAITSGVSNPDGWGIDHYQWQRSDFAPPADVPVDIAGATSVDYTLAPVDIGKYMRVCVMYLDPANTQLCSGTDTVAVGDPHITAVDGLHYDFQGAGEFVVLRNSSGMEIQLRMAAVPTAPPLPDPYTGLTSGVSVNTAVAARVGQHRVSYQPDTGPNAVAGTFVLRVDGAVTALPADGIDMGDGGRVLPQAGGIQIDFPDQTTLMVNTSSWPFYGAHWLHVNVFHTSAYEGIMGARLKGSWLPRLSNGTALGSMPASLHDRYVDLYVKFADSWRVTDKTSLFDYADGTSTATFTNKKWPTENGPYVTGAVPVAKPLDRKAAELACRDVVGMNEKADCVFDVRVMGNRNLAKGHLLHQQIRLGAVNVAVRGADKLNALGELVVTATVARHATVVPKVKGLRTVPAGTVQFMLGDKALGKPVRLDAKGRATLLVSRLQLERLKEGKLAITARFLPTRDKANVFLPGVSKRLTRELVPAALRAGAIIDVPRRLK